MLSAAATAPFFAQELGNAATNPAYTAIPEAGHHLGEERPTDFVRAVSDFLTHHTIIEEAETTVR